MSKDSLHCSNLPDFPIEVKFAAGGILGGKPLICGGLVELASSLMPTNNCYIFDGAIWSFFTSMNFKRQGAIGVAMDEETLWILGKQFQLYLLTYRCIFIGTPQMIWINYLSSIQVDFFRVYHFKGLGHIIVFYVYVIKSFIFSVYNSYSVLK